MSYIGFRYWLHDTTTQFRDYLSDFTLWICRPWANIHEEQWQLLEFKHSTNLSTTASCSRHTLE